MYMQISHLWPLRGKPSIWDLSKCWIQKAPCSEKCWNASFPFPDSVCSTVPCQNIWSPLCHGFPCPIKASHHHVALPVDLNFLKIIIIHLNTWRLLELKGWKQKWKLSFSFPAANLSPTALGEKKMFSFKNEESIDYFKKIPHPGSRLRIR